MLNLTPIIDAYIRRMTLTVHHPCGSCPMGIGPDTVLDPELKVRGIEKPARGRRFGDAGPRHGAYQRLRADDGGEGFRPHSRQNKTGGVKGSKAGISAMPAAR